MNKPPKTMTGAEFKFRFAPLLASLRDDDEIFFGSGDLSFYRAEDKLHTDGPRLINIEFNEIYKVLANQDDRRISAFIAALSSIVKHRPSLI